MTRPDKVRLVVEGRAQDDDSMRLATGLAKRRLAIDMSREALKGPQWPATSTIARDRYPIRKQSMTDSGAQSSF